MKKICVIIAFSLISLTCLTAFGFQKKLPVDSNRVKNLTQLAFDARLDSALLTVKLADSAIVLAKKLDDNDGLLADAYRTKGVGETYLEQYKNAYISLQEALKYYKNTDNRLGQARVNMNLGNLFRNDYYEQALDYYKLSLPVALSVNDSTLIASLKLNMGTVYSRMKKYREALTNYEAAQKIFEKLNRKIDIPNIISCIQNTGVVYYKLGKYDKAKQLLYKAYEAAKANDKRVEVASIGIYLAELNIATSNFNEAKKYIQEGLLLSSNAKSIHDYNYLDYQSQIKQKRFESAVNVLAKIYGTDSLANEQFLKQQIDIAKIGNQLKEKELTIAENKNTRSIAIGVGVAAVLLMAVVILLIANVKRKNESNKQLTDLNAEVSRQKENVDRINRHLEEIIDERTKDLQIKNKKLAEHSSYLSHQIRGPIATLKGLMNLEKEGLVEQEECINMMNKCVSEIDDKIIDMSDMLHNPGRTGL